MVSDTNRRGETLVVSFQLSSLSLEVPGASDRILPFDFVESESELNSSPGSPIFADAERSLLSLATQVLNFVLNDFECVLTSTEFDLSSSEELLGRYNLVPLAL